MIVYNFDLVWTVSHPNKANSVLDIYSDTMLSNPITLESLKPTGDIPFDELETLEEKLRTLGYIR